MNPQTYLGDGVYAEWDGYQAKIICNCMSEPNAIYLEPGALRALSLFVAINQKKRAVEDANEQTD